MKTRRQLRRKLGTRTSRRYMTKIRDISTRVSKPRVRLTHLVEEEERRVI